MRLMRFLLLLSLALMAPALAGCPADNIIPVHVNDRGENCGDNRPPLIGNVELNSYIPEGAIEYNLSIHFDWLDPGETTASQAPNLEGGRFSVEFNDALSLDVDLTMDILEAACFPIPSEDAENPCAGAGHSLGGCATNQVDTCVGAEVTFIYLAAPAVRGEFITMEFRIHDRCDGTSNEKSATYEIGSGLAIEGAGGGGDDDGA
jgi:hypothetical protein